MSKWSKRARVVIDKVITDNAGKPPHELLELANWAYPFGERSHHPYKVWRAEMTALQLRLTPPSGPEERPCPSCGARKGFPCRVIASMGSSSTMLDYHEARAMPPSGPLFANETTHAPPKPEADGEGR